MMINKKNQFEKALELVKLLNHKNRHEQAWQLVTEAEKDQNEGVLPLLELEK